MIICTYYKDSEKLLKLKIFMDEHNQRVFKLQSPKEVHTVLLTDNQKVDHSLDYISALNILDEEMRIIFIEGIAGETMEKLKLLFPKTGVNTFHNAIFSNRSVLFNKRIFSKYNLSLKFIKLRQSLASILNSYDIYGKSKIYPEIYKAIIDLGTLLNCKSLKEIVDYGLMPTESALDQIERKYSDIIKETDTTGIIKDKKRKARLKVEDVKEMTVVTQASILNKSGIEITEESVSPDKVQVGRQTYKPKLDARNYSYVREREMKMNELNLTNYVKLNVEKVREKSMKNTRNTFCKHTEYETDEEVFMYSTQKLNYSNQLMNRMRDKLENVKDAYFTYSKDFLSQGFPMINVYKNKEYEQFQMSKSVTT